MEQFLLVLAGGAVSLVGQWFLSDLQRKHKAKELYEARFDSYREELAKALAEFFDACAKYADSGTAVADADGYLSVHMDGGELQARAHRLWRDAIDQMTKAWTDARVKGYRLLTLVKKDHHLVAEIKALVMEPLPDAARADRKDLRLMSAKRRARLEQLTERLLGVFVPDPPPASESLDPSELQTTDRKLLP